MIISFKAKNKKQKIIKIVSLLALVFMLVIYYFYMSDQFSKANTKTQLQKISTNQTIANKKKKKKLERLIYKEIETLVDIIGQKHIKKIKVISNKVLILCDANTNLDALKVRYGVMALIKKTSKNIQISINVQKIIQRKYNVK